MIFVTVGTHEQPMRRLMSAIAPLPMLFPDLRRFVVQHGYSTPPPGWEAHFMLAPEELSSLMREAEIVICHGGPATISEARTLGKLPIVVPRSCKHGEHVDNHQLAYARRLAQEREVVLVEDPAELPAIISAFPSIRKSYPTPQGVDTRRAVERFTRIADELLQGKALD